ncbi:MAG: hypothetical protein ACQERD_06690 [Campylobacterota bacterium]
MKKLLLGTIILLNITYYANAAKEDSSYLTKQKLEIQELKKELNTFYNQKEKEYQERKKELEDILKKIESNKAQIESIKDENAQILEDINKSVENKITVIYNKMKAKTAAAIFNQMMAQGEIEDVFDIIVRLKEKNITQMMRYLSVQNAAKLTQMFENYDVNEEKGE